MDKDVLQNRCNTPKKSKRPKVQLMNYESNLAIIVKDKWMQIRRVFKK